MSTTIEHKSTPGSDKNAEGEINWYEHIGGVIIQTIYLVPYIFGALAFTGFVLGLKFFLDKPPPSYPPYGQINEEHISSTTEIESDVDKIINLLEQNTDKQNKLLINVSTQLNNLQSEIERLSFEVSLLKSELESHKIQEDLEKISELVENCKLCK
ncbi:hypothetical protein [Nitrosomonas ureae]|uniref:Uncharacterized protein n=1 Tax=Nitrosomonas ureae TaxID=44577 RepID=A0A1H5WFG4_9PROT|nr:hypothetical protein [Nitrosomonas ureae]SEF97931.1 hypothetical protein SAMN05216334_11816 [Nitrosomonas ureae]